jgi:hypothetical protein
MKDSITLDQVKELYEFLQGNNPDSILMGKRNHPKMNYEKAYNVIWFLQEHLRVLPSSFEKCSICANLYDRASEGHYNDEKYPGKFYCTWCDHLAPEDSFED